MKANGTSVFCKKVPGWDSRRVAEHDGRCAAKTLSRCPRWVYLAPGIAVDGGDIAIERGCLIHALQVLLRRVLLQRQFAGPARTGPAQRGLVKLSARISAEPTRPRRR